MNINIQQLKRQLQIEPDYTDDDLILQQCLNVAVQATENYVGSGALTGYTGYAPTGYTGITTAVPISLEQAVVMLAAHYYLNRNMVAFAEAKEVPYTYQFLLNPYKEITIA